MSTNTLTKTDYLPAVDMGVADEVIAGLRGRLSGLKADTPAGYEQVRAGIAEVRTLRTGVEKSRKELKASALEWGRKVDAEAKRVTSLLLEVEEPLKQEKARIDREIEDARRAKEEEARRKREEAERIEREKREAEQRAERERIRQEQEAERKKLEAERAELERQRAEERQRREAEEAKLAEERRKIEEERRRIEEDRRKSEEAERKRKEAAERKKREKEEAERRKREAEEAKRLAEERKPDREKLSSFIVAVGNVKPPSMSTEWGKERLSSWLEYLSDMLTEWKSDVE